MQPESPAAAFSNASLVTSAPCRAMPAWAALRRLAPIVDIERPRGLPFGFPEVPTLKRAAGLDGMAVSGQKAVLPVRTKITVTTFCYDFFDRQKS